MRTAPSPPPRDPDFDPPRGAGPVLRTEVVVYYQRLVVNPFLALICVSTSLAIGRWASQNSLGGEWVVSIGVVGVVVTCLLFQYHCLDCGETGPFHRWERHACPRVRERSARMHVMAHRFPTASSQFMFWIIVLMALILYYLSGPGELRGPDSQPIPTARGWTDLAPNAIIIRPAIARRPGPTDSEPTWPTPHPPR